jgi:hypothetical protein
MPEADLAAEPHSLRVGPAKQQRVREPLEQNAVDGGAVQIEYSDNSAHAGLLLGRLASTVFFRRIIGGVSQG